MKSCGKEYKMTTFTPTKDVTVKQVVNSIMNDYTNATGIACVYVDIKGKERSYKYNFTSFCQFMRSIPQFRDKCNKCDVNGGLETFKNRFCFPYRCHAGLVDFAVPIVSTNQLNGFIVSGQMASEDTRIPQFQNVTEWSDINGMYKRYQDCPHYRYEEIMSASRVLNTLTTCYFPFSDTQLNTLFPTNEIGSEPTRDLSAITRPEICKTVEYVKSHLCCNLTLHSIADEVFLSESYLSKLFKQEMKMNLMQYINQCRIIEAQRMLTQSKWSVDMISRRLGYHRTSYFCKIFKQFTGDTPHAYRKKHEID